MMWYHSVQKMTVPERSCNGRENVLKAFQNFYDECARNVFGGIVKNGPQNVLYH